MRLRPIAFFFLCLLLPLAGAAQKVSPTATYVDDDKNTVEKDADFAGQAPLTVTFRANPSEMGAHTPSYEWHFRREGTDEDVLVRYEEQTEYTFLESGSFLVTLVTRLTDDGTELGEKTIKVTISESKLEFPNAFSPNDDGINDIYRAKQPDGYRSIVEFHGYIFNRWGQKLYEWTDVSQGWNGKYKGSDVKEGVYFLLAKARGADGRVYNIRKDINLLRHYIEGASSSSSSSSTTE